MRSAKDRDFVSSNLTGGICGNSRTEQAVSSKDLSSVTPNHSFRIICPNDGTEDITASGAAAKASGFKSRFGHNGNEVQRYAHRARDAGEETEPHISNQGSVAQRQSTFLIRRGEDDTIPSAPSIYPISLTAERPALNRKIVVRIHDWVLNISLV